MQNEIRGRPVANVWVIPVAGANSLESDADGKFTLYFPDKEPGQGVDLTIDKPGDVVVNDVQLEKVLLPRKIHTDAA